MDDTVTYIIHPVPERWQVSLQDVDKVNRQHQGVHSTGNLREAVGSH